jgi:hypothetical protein
MPVTPSELTVSHRQMLAGTASWILTEHSRDSDSRSLSDADRRFGWPLISCGRGLGSAGMSLGGSGFPLVHRPPGCARAMQRRGLPMFVTRHSS